MSFEQDVFISYAHLDNRPLLPDQQGWVTRFHATFDAILSSRLGRPAKIWWDDKLRGNDEFGVEIVERFSKCALLTSIVTPRYLESEWCRKEIGEFCRQAEEFNAISIANKVRVFKIIKTPVHGEQSLPDPVRRTRGYEFYKDKGGAPLEFDPVFGKELEVAFTTAVARLAWDVKELLDRVSIVEHGAPSKPTSEPVKATIYLAECSYDRRSDRADLETDLKTSGYRVLPDTELPRDELTYRATVKDMLERSDLSIHLVGSGYGAVPDGPGGTSVVEIQNEVAAELCRVRRFARFVWMPAHTRSDQPQQQAFLNLLRTDAATQFASDLIEGDLADLKQAVHKHLEAASKQGDEFRIDERPDDLLVYLIYDQRDRRAVLPLRKLLTDRGVQVAVPAFEGDAAEVRKVNQESLTHCDATILFYGAGDEAWKRSMDNEMKRSRAYRAGNMPALHYTCLAQPVTSDKQELLDLDAPRLVNGLSGVDPDQIDALLDTLSKRGAS